MRKQATWYERNNAPDANASSKGYSEFAGVPCRIVDYNPNTHLVQLVKASDGEPLIDGIGVETSVDQRKPYEQPSAKIIKTLAAPDAPIVEVNDLEASIRGSSNSGFYSLREGGNIVKGAISFSASPSEIKIAGVTNLNPLITSCFPSTIVTPIPTTQWAIPGAGMLGTIAKDVILMGTLMGAFSGA